MSSRASARSQLAALKSFIAFHEAELKLNGLKVRVPRVRKKPYLPWNDAKKIILECKPPFRELFDFLLWSGLGLDELKEIQTSTEIQQSIEKQRADPSRAYIRIDLRPRKSNIDTYFALVPKEHVPHFPILTADLGNRGRQLVTSGDAEMNWLRARRRAGNQEIGIGPHTLRSAFRSECGRLGVADAVAESQMGHGGRERYGYSRETSDETYVAGELSKLWKAAIPVTRNDLESRDMKIESLAKENEELREILSDPQKLQNLWQKKHREYLGPQGMGHMPNIQVAEPKREPIAQLIESKESMELKRSKRRKKL